MNVHHLELFYYVATYGGISAAVRRMPYGIQQPAVSAQLLQLEGDLGTRLFQRRPFELTPAGQKLYAFVQPFFGKLARVADELRGSSHGSLRLAGSGAVLRDHLPALLQEHCRRFTGLNVTLRQANQHIAEELLGRDEIDLAFTEIEAKPAPGIRRAALLHIPMILLAPRAAKIRNVRDLWRDQLVTQPLIALPETETITRVFRQELRRLEVVWPTRFEVSTLDLVEAYVAAGFGIGLSVAVPGLPPPESSEVIRLPKFPELVVGALWRGKLSPPAQAFLDAASLASAMLAQRWKRSSTGR